MIKPADIFFGRAAKQMVISNSTEQLVKNVKKKPEISDHVLLCDCLIGFNCYDILVSDTNKIRLIVKKHCLTNLRNQF